MVMPMLLQPLADMAGDSVDMLERYIYVPPGEDDADL